MHHFCDAVQIYGRGTPAVSAVLSSFSLLLFLFCKPVPLQRANESVNECPYVFWYKGSSSASISLVVVCSGSFKVWFCSASRLADWANVFPGLNVGRPGKLRCCSQNSSAHSLHFPSSFCVYLEALSNFLGTKLTNILAFFPSYSI